MDIVSEVFDKHDSSHRHNRKGGHCDDSFARLLAHLPRTHYRTFNLLGADQVTTSGAAHAYAVETGEFDRALKLGRDSHHPIARVMAAGLAHRNPAPAKAMEAAAQAQFPCSKAGLVPSIPLSPWRHCSGFSERLSA